MRRLLLAGCVLTALSSPLAASGNPYEDAAKVELGHLASSILAASVCTGVRFNADTVIPHLAAAAKTRRSDILFSHEGKH
jgi:hypothetical protein